MLKEVSRIGLILLLFSISIHSTGQTGPGGVGNSSNNILWLEADNLTGLSDGDDISSWSDGSGNGNDVSQPDASFKPIFKPSVLGGYPVVRFNKTNGRLRKTSFSDFPTTSITAIYVNANSESSDGVLSYASSAGNNDFLLFNSSSLTFYRSNTNYNSGVSLNSGSFNIVNASWRSSDGNIEIWKNGTLSASTTGHMTGSSITAGGSLAVAGEQDAVDGSYDSGQDHLGDFSEVIIYNTFLNTAQQVLVANYLSAKYNLSIANDYFAYESTHNFDVAGIGREDASNTHTAARSGNILQVENASGLNANQEYLLFGHDNGDVTTSWSTSEAPNSGVDIQRLTREWRFSENGNVGTVDFVVDVDSFPALPSGHNMYALMVDSDGDFSNGASVYEMVLVSGTEYSATGIDIANGNYVAIAAVKPTIGHTLATSSGSESSDAVIEVSLNFIPQSSKSINYTTSNGTALSSQPDYTAVSGNTLTISAGNSSNSYTISINDDATFENNENFTVTLSNPSVGINLSGNTSHQYTIIDDDASRKVYFNSSTSSGNESVTTVSVSLSLSSSDPSSSTTVDYSVTGGTADSGTDFSSSSGTVTFSPGVTSQSFNFNVSNDALNENDETIIISLSNPTNCNLDLVTPFAGTGFVTHTYTIEDNDDSEMEFNSVSSSGAESINIVNFQVNLDAVSGIDVSASYTVSGTATGSGVDYTLADGTVSIPAGSTTTNITAYVNNDITEENTETIIITLSSPVNTALGSNTVHTYSILNDDVFGFEGPGGIGSSSNNVLWVKSDDLSVVSDGTDITTWADASGNSNDLSQSNASFKPRYYSNVVNGQPVVRFEQVNDRIVKTSFDDFPTDAITAIMVNKNSDSGDGLLSYASSSNSNEYLWFNSSNLALFRAGANVSSGTSFNNGSFNIIGSSWQSSGGNVKLYKNGTQSYSTTMASGTIMTNGGSLAIAGEQDGINASYQSSQSHNGDFTEIIIYNEVINDTRRKILDNYLSAKYDISISNDLYSYDSPGNFEHDVAGIGQDDASNYHLDAQGTGIVRVLNVSDLDNNEFLLWGHNNEGLYFSNSSDVPGSVSSRLNQVWRAAEVNNSGSSVDVGSIDMYWEYADLGISTPANLRLLIDSDNDGNFNDETPISGSVSGSYIQFTGITDIDNGVRFTLASTSDHSITWNGTSFNGGSGASSAPDNTDGSRSFIVYGSSGALSASATVDNMAVTSDGVLTIGSGVILTVNNEIENEGVIIIEGTGALVQTHSGSNNNSGSGVYRIKQTGQASSTAYNVWSSPIQEKSLTTAFPGSNPCDMFVFEGATQSWKYDFTSGYSTSCLGNPVTFGSNHVISGGDGIMDVARGYFSTGGSSVIKEFTGDVNNGDLTIGVNITNVVTDPSWAGNDWNLVGNPYPSGLNASAFWNENAVDNNRITDAIFFWDDDEEDYASWNLSGGVSAGAGSSPNGVIGVAQGFWVAANSNTNIVFNNSMRAGTNNQFFKNQNTNQHNVWVSVDSPEGNRNNILIGFNDQSTDGFDPHYDAHKLSGNPDLKFASVMNNEDYVIQSVAPIGLGSQKTIPLSLFTADTGLHVFTESKRENLTTDFKVYLRDLEKGVTHDLAHGDYAVYLDGNQTFDDRFELVFDNYKAPSSGSQNTNPSDSLNAVSVEEFTKDDYRLISTEEGAFLYNENGIEGDIKVYDVTGKLVWSQTNVSSLTSLEINLNSATTGVYLVQVTDQGQPIFTKKLVKSR